MFKSKNQFEVLVSIGLANAVTILKEAGFTMSVSLKGYALLSPTDDLYLVPRVCSTKLFLQDEATESQVKQQVGYFKEVFLGIANQLGVDFSEVGVGLPKSDTPMPPVLTAAELSEASSGGSLAGYVKGAHSVGYNCNPFDTDKSMAEANHKKSPKKSSDPVPLSMATKLMQPVLSTSTGSVYHVVALNKALKIAVRCKGGTVSMRAEGDLETYSQLLMEVGFVKVKGCNYTSFHVGVDSAMLMRKVIYSAIAGMGCNMETVSIAQLDLLQGLGK